MKTIDNKKEGGIIQIYPRQTEIRQSITQGSTVNSNPSIEEQGENTVAESSTSSNPAIGVQEKSIQVVKIKPNTYDTLRQSAKTKNNEASEQTRSQKQEMESLTENSEDLTKPFRFSNSEACTGKHPTEFHSGINSNLDFDNSALNGNSVERHKNTDSSANPTMETNAADETFKNIKHKEKSATFYVKLFALFFFFGVCLCVSGKWKADGMGKKLISIFDKDLNSFSSFCVNLAPIVFSSFVVFASGFTLYAPFVTWIYSACMFFVIGVLSGYMVTSLGINLVIITTLILIGIFSVLNVTLCVVSVGMSKIATNGIKGISISDGIIYFVIYVVYMAATWGIVSGIKGLIS